MTTMHVDCYDDDSTAEWLRELTDVPRTLQQIFRYPSTASRHALADEIATALKVERENLTVLAADFLLVLGEAIAEATADEGGVEIAGTAVEEYGIADAIALLMFFGWQNAMIPAAPAKRLQVEVQQVLTRQVGAKVDTTLRLWRSSGAI